MTLSEVEAPLVQDGEVRDEGYQSNSPRGELTGAGVSVLLLALTPFGGRRYNVSASNAMIGSSRLAPRIRASRGREWNDRHPSQPNSSGSSAPNSQ